MIISYKLALGIAIIIAIIILFFRKSKGLGGKWDSRQDIEEFAIIFNPNDDKKENKTNLPNYEKKIKKQTPNHEIQNMGKKNKDNINIISENKFPQKKCNDSIGEQICRSHLEKRLGTKFTKQRPDFLKNPITNTNLELDCFSEQLKLALEYNGKQHYEFVSKFHKSSTDFHNQKYRDSIKKQLCYKNGIDLIEVPYTISHYEIPLYIDRALEKLGRIKII